MLLDVQRLLKQKACYVVNTVIIGCALLTHSFHVYASDKEDKVIARVINAYGGDKLKALNSIKVYDNYKQLYTGQGVRNDDTEVMKSNIELTIDFKNERKSLIEWEQKERGTRLIQTIFDGNKARIHDLFHNTYEENNHYNFSNMGAHIVRLHDTLLAHLVWQSKNTAKYIGESHYRNAIHDKLQINMAGNIELILHIHRSTGLISKMTRTNTYVGEIAYVFSNYRITNGITYAADLQLSIAGNPELISVARKIDVNPELTHAFVALANTKKRGETIDSSKMKVHTLGDGVYFAGQGHAFSLFVDAGGYFIAAGGNAGLAARFEAVKKEIGSTKPLEFQIVTHHHSDHLASMNDAASLGANFITVAEHISSIQNSLNNEVSTNRFYLIKEHDKYANGDVEIYDIASTHSEHNLMVYVPKAKLMFTADHFSSDLKTDLPNADKGTVVLHKAIENLQLDVEFFLGAHGSRILTYKDLQAVANSYIEKSCPAMISVCRD